MENSFDLLQEIVKLLREINDKLDNDIRHGSIGTSRPVEHVLNEKPVKPTKSQLEWKRRHDLLNRMEQNRYLQVIRADAKEILNTMDLDDLPALQLSSIAELSRPKKLYQHPFYQAVKAEYFHFIEASQYKAKEILKKKYNYYKALDKDFLQHDSN